MTLRVRRGIPSFRSVSLVREFERSLARGAERGDFRVVHYSLQRDHAHLIVEATSREALGRGMKSIAARLARAANRVFGRRGPILAGRYHLRVLRTPREVRNALAYVLLNARKHAAKQSRGASAGVARVDPASSGRWFDGWRRRIELPRAHGAHAPPAVARPHTWILRVGWRRHGLLDPAHVPGCSSVARAPRRMGR